MAEPYVPIATYTTYSNLLSELEVATNEAKTNADLLDGYFDTTLNAKTTSESLLAQKFNLMFMVGG